MLNKYRDLEDTLDMSYHPIANGNPQCFTAHQIAEYNERGYIEPISLFQGEELKRIHEYFIGEGNLPADLSARFQNGDIVTARSGLSMHNRDAGIYDIVTHPRTVAYLKDLLGENIICHVSRFKSKPPRMVGSGEHHQDATFNAMNARCAIVWLAIEDADVENGCMWFVPGSHKLGVVECDEKHYVINRSKYGQEEPCEVKAGHAIFMNDLVMHSSPANRSQNRFRPALTATYVAAETEPYEDAIGTAILCSGTDIHGYWKPQPRPEGPRLFG